MRRGKRTWDKEEESEEKEMKEGSGGQAEGKGQRQGYQMT